MRGRSNVPVRPPQVDQILESAWSMRSEIVPCLIGAPGIGKTQGIYRFAEKKGAKVVEIIASQILPNEVSGITMPVADTHSMEIYDHARLSSLKDGDILFFDELLQAPPQTLSACLTLIQERRLMSGKKLPDIMIVAATNPLNSPTMLPLSIRQRFMFIDVVFSSNDYIDYMKREHCIDVNSKLLHKIVDESDQYNALTPRTLTKLFQWANAAGVEDKGFMLAVETMFDEVLYEDIVDSMRGSERTQVVRAIKNYLEDNNLEDDGITDKVINADLRDMLGIIESLPNGQEILEYLGATEYKERRS